LSIDKKAIREITIENIKRLGYKFNRRVPRYPETDIERFVAFSADVAELIVDLAEEVAELRKELDETSTG
jgi:DNA-binding winged helix-turn-helix (wHTH) protein